jgi:hypothetical protein
LAGRIPKSVGRNEIEEREYEADDKCAEEKIPEENDFVAFHYRGFARSDDLFLTNVGQ